MEHPGHQRSGESSRPRHTQPTTATINPSQPCSSVDRGLGAELVETCIAMFLPEMPEHGRAAGLIGPAVSVPAGAPAQVRLLGAMGRRP